MSLQSSVGVINIVLYILRLSKGRRRYVGDELMV